ncbi:hypothetical protein [Herbiconiux daphne]|uniref:Uncharacterized protein n=1 Tax=Herbiconiux daphne TaxID=2970914 RepID=A0ABT2HAX3_9MICO|nr:hypothetical protein [Herbiconiux daphne]MCS5737022.1 hypothetical protein [Herbiconiux daphne]
MARLDLTNKTAAAAATSTIKTAGTKKLFTFDDIAKFTSKEMVDVINHKAGTV